jgi:hypothetical protein
MGEVADDMMDGVTCCLCGMFFVEGEDEDGNIIGHEHGYPAACWDCWRRLSKKERRNYQRAIVPTSVRRLP